MLENISSLSLSFEDKSPQAILQWASDTYGSKLAMATAFGAEGCAIIAMLAEIGSDAFIFNLDTGYQFAETLETRRLLVEKYGLPIELVTAKQSVAEMEHENNGPIYGSNPDLCCHIRKVVPLREAIAGYDAWISAIRRDQTSVRSEQPIVGWDNRFSLVKINPLANWTKQDVWNYIVKNDVPYNPLYDQGYRSIGCSPCTRAIGDHEDERAGRWSGTAKQECGLHTVNTRAIEERVTAPIS